VSKPTALERYWAKIDTSGGPDACWPWTAGAHESGRGVFSVGGRSVIATRFGYRALVGPIPEGYFVCHRCDNPGCMNPMDWFLGTPADNMADRDSKGRACVGDRHWTRTNPERILRGDEHGSHTNPEIVLRGERHPNAKLTEMKVIEIRRRHASGESRMALCARFDVKYQTLRCVVERRTWKHIA
jgi:hypothetical protein